MHVGKVDLDLDAGDEDVKFRHVSGETQDRVPLTHWMERNCQTFEKL